MQASCSALCSSDPLHYAVVDEGPGLSGSSFQAVVQWLVALGVAHERIWLFPSHPQEPGPMAAPAVRASYRASRRVHVSFDEHFHPATPKGALAGWFADLIGEPVRAVSDLSGGHWRAQLYRDEAAYPASHVQQERRKYLLHCGAQDYLLRFTTLGPFAEQLRARAHKLTECGLMPPVYALRHGLTLGAWLRGARPLQVPLAARDELVLVVARYLTVLSRAFAVDRHRAGATPSALFVMMEHNLQELLGAEVREQIEPYRHALAALDGAMRPTATDNKLDAHEWLLTPDGRIWKSDALDHHVGHDCIGCQDPAWDVAGACLELGFDRPEREQLLRALRDEARLAFSEPQLAFYELAYLAFRAGHATLAAQSLAASAPDEVGRMLRLRERYLTLLRERLQVSPRGERADARVLSAHLPLPFAAQQGSSR